MRFLNISVFVAVVFGLYLECSGSACSRAAAGPEE
jgi:hypothetical protein